MTKREESKTLREMEDNQVLLKASIEESRRLTEKAQTLLDRHRKESDA